MILRVASVKRETAEVNISLTLRIEGKGLYKGDTGINFLNHMLTILSKHSSMDITINATGDLTHHLIEDLGIVLGQAYLKALGEKRGIHRFGFAYVPMDDALARSVVDLSGRTYASIILNLVKSKVEDIDIEDLEHFLYSFTENLKANIHIEVLSGMNDHHKIEAAVKSLALALKQASSTLEKSRMDIPSTKGML